MSNVDKDLVRKIIAKMNSQRPFSRENAPELIRQLIKVITRDYDVDPNHKMMRDLRNWGTEIQHIPKK